MKLVIQKIDQILQKFIKFLQDKFFSSNKYDELIDELHEEEIIDDNDLERQFYGKIMLDKKISKLDRSA